MVKGILCRLLSVAAILFVASVAHALTVDHGERQYNLELDGVIAGSNFSVRMYAPFRRQEVLFEGYHLKDFLESITGHKVDTATVYAIDGYSQKITDLQTGSWVLVTKENGYPLSIREHGPLRLIETDLGGRTSKNISLFDNWIWMIDRIVVDK